MKTPVQLPNPNVAISPVGLRITAKLTFEEWRDLATSIGYASRSIAFIVGDWLIHGQASFGPDAVPERRVPLDAYRQAIAATGMDLSTVQNYAYVSRNVPYAVRSELLSWEHHRLLAKLPVPRQADWIADCVAEEKAGRRMTTRRLRKSLSLGRLASERDMEPDEADKGVANHIPFVNRLVLWWRHMQDERFLTRASREQRNALKRDLEPVVRIYNQL